MKLIAPSGTPITPVTTADGTVFTPAVDGSVSATAPSQILNLLAMGFAPDLRDLLLPPASLHYDRPMLPGGCLPAVLLCL